MIIVYDYSINTFGVVEFILHLQYSARNITLHNEYICYVHKSRYLTQISFDLKKYVSRNIFTVK